MKPKTTTTFTNGANWSPQGDGIDVTLPLPLPPSFPCERGDIDACIDAVLYGPTTKKRLPSFPAISPD
ncbi:hypothetical protein V6N13_018717 [Hibiscus sabdariffa]|uniref:Uncharacterized protein n=1 Tax=Hibiscus sabdariffa TaxID=183260 RepID=A0ABR2ELH5_9ROSI